jgi:hypothetical protein
MNFLEFLGLLFLLILVFLGVGYALGLVKFSWIDEE